MPRPSWRRIFRNNQLLVRLILSYLISGALLTGLLLLLVSGYIADRISRQSYQSASQLLQQAYAISYNVLTDIYGDFYYLWSKDPAIQEALTAASLIGGQGAAISRLLDATAFRDPLVHSVCLINEPAGTIISNLAGQSGLGDYFDPGALALFQDFGKNFNAFKDDVFFSRQASILLSGQPETRSFISIVLAGLDPQGQLSSGLIVNIDQARLSAQINISPENGQVMIIGQSGKVISCLDSGMLGQDFPEASLYRDILADPSAGGNLLRDYQGEKSFISYQKADTLGFIFIKITAYDQIMAPVRQANRIIALLFSGVILLSLITSILATRQIYQPLNRLVRTLQDSPSIDAESGQDEYTYLSAAFGDLIARNQQSQLVRLIQGHGDSKTLNILGFRRAKFLAAAVRPDQAEHAGRAWLELLARLIQQTLRLPAAVAAANCASLVFNADHFDDIEMNWILAQAALLQQAAADNLQATVSIGIGTVVTDPESIRTSHRNALTAVQQAAELGSSQMVLFGEIEDNRLNANQNRASIAAAIEAYIQANYSRPDLSVDEIATHIGLSTGYMRQIFKLDRSLPINDLIIACRINRACELLAGTDLTAKDISESVGYLDSRYFYTLFKKKVGMTTDEYRRSHREDKNHEKI